MIKIENLGVNYIFTDELLDVLKKLTSDSALNEIEYGLQFYLNFKNPEILEYGNLCIGTSCDVKLYDTDNRKVRGYSVIGDFHAHMKLELQKEPGEDISDEDLIDILEHEITCIGFNHNKMACYVLNKINDETYIQNLRNDDITIKEYLKTDYRERKESLKDEFYNVWDRIFNVYTTSYYIDLNTQTII